MIDGIIIQILIIFTDQRTASCNTGQGGAKIMGDTAQKIVAKLFLFYFDPALLLLRIQHLPFHCHHHL